ncbi:MAG: HEAT repeat domain-containing protein [Actinomycetota bacterium]|nr:HEAT repeat domain-containing protein [Actinomycetota bacterium]
MADGAGGRLAYWPRVWAARSMAYLGDLDAVGPLVNGISDEHWRVRMTCIQSLGRLGAEGLTGELVRGLGDEHRRVREATVVALGRVGNGDAIRWLSRALATEPENRKLEVAISRIEQRRGA